MIFASPGWLLALPLLPALLAVEAWLTRAQKRVAKAWLAEHEPD